MELKSVGFFGDCFEPDKSHPFNFVLDTTAINKLAERPEDVKLLKKAGTELAYEFFLCRIQHGEVVGMKSDGSFHKNFSASDEKSKQMRAIIDTLPARRIPCLAAFVQRGILLDGTSYLVDSHGKLYEVFENVFNNNPENIEDAIIVESAIRHNQVFTYVKNKDAEFGNEPHAVSGMLLYAQTDETVQPNHVYHMSGNKISVRTLDLNCPFKGIAAQLDGIVTEHFR